MLLIQLTAEAGLSKIIIAGDLTAPDDDAIESFTVVRYHDVNKHCEEGLLTFPKGVS